MVADPTQQHSPANRQFRGMSGRGFLVSAAVIGALVVSFLGPTAAAAEPQVSVNPSEDLDPSGGYVTVEGSGFEPNTELFVMQCLHGADQDTSLCNPNAMQKATTDDDGDFAVRGARYDVRFGTHDCLEEQCAMSTSAVSGHSDDRSQDTHTAIDFEGAEATESAEETTPDEATTSAENSADEDSDAGGLTVPIIIGAVVILVVIGGGGLYARSRPRSVRD